MADQPTVEGHDTSSKDAVLEHQEGNKTPCNLGPENDEESPQNLENSEAMVAHDDGLEAAMNESAGSQVFEVEHPQTDTKLRLEPKVGIIDAEFREGYEPEQAKPNVEALQAAYGSMRFPDPPSEAAVNMDIRGVPTNFHIGLQPDGTTKVIVTIQEGYWEAVQQWAEADGVPVERWLSDRLYEYISTYGEPAKGR